MTDLAPLQQALNRTLPTARLQRYRLPGCNGLTLALINDDFDTGPLPQAVMNAVIAEPAYWAFCWGSGLALAQELLADPDRVRGKRVLDFGAGSGVAGIAAAMAGARSVIACDNDRDALLACRSNASLNGVALELCDSLEALSTSVDCILLADVLYDRSNLPLLRALKSLHQGAPSAPALIIADSRIADLSRWGFHCSGTRQALTLPNLGEFDEFATVRFFEAAPGQG
ncbi:MAG: 50S ribosomal protein L11 methyltransferase [Pseudomonadota bacterium]